MVSKEFIKWYKEQSVDVKFQVCKMTGQAWRNKNELPGLIFISVMTAVLGVGFIYLLWKAGQ